MYSKRWDNVYVSHNKNWNQSDHTNKDLHTLIESFSCVTHYFTQALILHTNKTNHQREATQFK